MNKCLSTNQKLWRDRVEMLECKIDTTVQEKEVELKELQEQVRDLMFYLEAQNKVGGSPEGLRQELQEGRVHMAAATPPSSTASSSSTTARKPRRKK